jgi:hypothetical protein
MVRHYAISIETHILTGADMISIITDCVGQLILVRYILHLPVSIAFTPALNRYIGAGLSGIGAITSPSSLSLCP